MQSLGIIIVVQLYLLKLYIFGHHVKKISFSRVLFIVLTGSIDHTHIVTISDYSRT